VPDDGFLRKLFQTLFVNTSARDCLERFVSEMTCYESSGT